MITFKEFYLQSSKDNKAPARAPRSFKTPKRRNEILDRIAKLKAARFVLASTHRHFDDANQHVRIYPLTGHNADIAKPTRLTHSTHSDDWSYHIVL